jgi:hypothetical protein
MDVSKLPRLSNSSEQRPAPTEGAASDPVDVPAAPRPVPVDPYGRDGVRPGVGAEVWLSAILGVVFLAIGWNFARYLTATLGGGTFHTGVNWTVGPKAGTEVGYFELQGGTAYTDSGIFLFGLAMVFEAVALLAGKSPTKPRAWLVAIGLVVALAATLYNVAVCVIVFGRGIFPLVSVLCVAFGGYISMYEWRLLQALRLETQAPS